METKFDMLWLNWGILNTDYIPFKNSFSRLLFFFCVCKFPQTFYTVFWFLTMKTPLKILIENERAIQVSIAVGTYLNVYFLYSNGSEPGIYDFVYLFE